MYKYSKYLSSKTIIKEILWKCLTHLFKAACKGSVNVYNKTNKILHDSNTFEKKCNFHAKITMFF